MIFLNEFEEKYGIDEPVEEISEPSLWEKNMSMLPEELENCIRSNRLRCEKNNNKFFIMTNDHGKKEADSCPFFGYPIEVDCSTDCLQYDDCMRYLDDN